jgi:predicted transcriptional regulator
VLAGSLGFWGRYDGLTAGSRVDSHEIRGLCFLYAATKEYQTMPSAKDAARQIIDHLPDQATWDDIMYELYVKSKIEDGLADIEAGRTVPHEQVKAELLGRGN